MDIGRKNQEANVTSDVLQDTLILSIDNIYESWVVVSGASFHATLHRKHFLDYVQGDLDKLIWVMMHHAKFLEWERYKIMETNGC
jgi:hypothetical protein